MRREISTKGVLMKEQVHLALGTPQKFVQLGNFCVKVRDQSMNVYYNMDLGNSKTKEPFAKLLLRRSLEK